MGERLYGHWVQWLPKDLRKQLQIDGKPVAELDYAGMQLALLYAIQGRSVPEGDPYAVSGFSREDMKAVLTRSVGTPNREEALVAIRSQLHDENRSRKGRAEQLYDAFWNAHAEVCPHHTGNEAAWSKLQMLDSQLALGVVASLLAQRVTPIPIHDSFVVQKQYADLTAHDARRNCPRCFLAEQSRKSVLNTAPHTKIANCHVPGGNSNKGGAEPPAQPPGPRTDALIRFRTLP